MTNRHDPLASVEFIAFRELHHPRYLSYARVWFRESGLAASVVEEAFAAMAASWAEILGSPNPTAAAWRILRATVSSRFDPARVPTQRITAADEDLAILHYVVGLATPEIADTVGTDTANVASQLRHALRDVADW
ncbi:hypothetical protein KCMC57_up42030 [Kitasatospora sp. CMC57]|uniref:RNA polymerase sigma factor 70 region 4 type 2 domain-containing protein n=1 Tax=Kitasatospora sp. CMC57 TaxID=3231513 RepID=A0AB33JXA6_9ACTN